MDQNMNEQNNYQDNYQDNTANVQPQSYSQEPAPQQTNTLAVVSLVLGILSIVCGCCMGWVGILFSIGGIICAVFANKQGKTGLAKAGLICSIVGIVLSIIVTILSVIASIAILEGMGGLY